MPPYRPSGIRFAAFCGQLQSAGARKVQLPVSSRLDGAANLCHEKKRQKSSDGGLL
jgi:hypothetical protein